MISFTARTDDPKVRIAIEAAFVEERERMLRRIARVSRGVAAGDSYERSAFLTCRDLFGGHVVNTHTWHATYAGTSMSEYHLATYSDRMVQGGGGYSPRPWADVTESDLIADVRIPPNVSRETEPDVLATLIAAVPLATPPTPEPDLDTLCSCSDCGAGFCRGSDDDNHEQCDTHSCTECFGDGYTCDDHGCDDCRPDCYTTQCCGWCSECGSHPNGVDTDDSDDGDNCSNCGYCHRCEHVCGDQD